MKTRIVIVWLLCCPLHSFAQDEILKKGVNIHVEKTSLSEIFALINAQTGAVFSYNPQQVDVQQKRSACIDGKALENMLPQLLPPGISFKANGRYIILFAAEDGMVSSNKKIPDFPAQKIPIQQTKITATSFSNSSLHDYSAYPIKKITPVNSGEPFVVCHSSINSNTIETMKKQLFTLMLASVAGASIPVAAQTNDATQTSGTKIGQVTFIYPLGTDGKNSSNNTYAFSLNVLGGLTGGVKGAEFASLYNINYNAMSGAQFGGLLNLTKENVSGAQFAGLANLSTGKITGVQFAGLLNTAQSASGACQFAGIANVNAEQGMLQFGGIANMSGSGNAGVQIAGVANMADSMATQIAGIVNITKRGGFQLGIVNIRDTADGGMLGVVNIAKKGGLFELEASAGEFIHAQVAFRSGTEKLYSILSLGYNFNNDIAWSFGFGLGTTWKFGKNAGINLEGMYYTLADERFSTSSFNSLAQVRPLFYFQLGNRMKLFAGPALNLYIADNTADNKLQVKTPYTIWSLYNPHTKYETWIGGSAGLRINL